MNYEEKYKSALGWMQSLYGGLHGVTKEEAEKYFPELKEPNDERIRKAIKGGIRHLETQLGYDAVDGVDILDIYSWLEKQGEPEDKGEISDGYHTFNELYSYRMLYNAAFFNLLPKQLVHKSKRHHDGEECFGGGWFIVMANLPTGQISNHYELKDWDLFQIPEKEIADEWDGHTPQEAAERLHKYLLEKQNEQPTDKVEPKFKVGDWIILPLGIIARIDSINSTDYQVTTTDGKICDFKISKQDNYRLWSITDAKDGDMLATSAGAFIYNGNNGGGDCPGSYCGINTLGRFQLGSETHWTSKKVYPATNEQRDLLFEEMKESGYEWDGEKKELKKIESNTLDPDKVIEWLKTNVFDDSAYGKAMIEHFKKDLGL